MMNAECSPKLGGCASKPGGLGMEVAGKAGASIPGVRLRAADGLVQGILRVVVIRECPEILGAGLSEVLLGLDVFQDDADAILLAFAREAQRFGRGGEVPLGQGDLGPQGLDVGNADYDLGGDGVLELRVAELDGGQLGFAGVDAAGVEQTARTDAPVQADQVVGFGAEVAGAAVWSAAEAAAKGLGADGGNEWSIDGPVLCRAGRREQGLALLEFGAVVQGLRDQGVHGGVC